MEEDLRQRATDTVNYYEFSAGQQRGAKGPFLWQKASAKRVLDQLFLPTEAQRLQKPAEYQDLMVHKLKELNVKTHTGGTCDVQYFIEDYLVRIRPA